MYIGIPHHTLEPQVQGLLAGRFFFPPFNWQMAHLQSISSTFLARPSFLYSFPNQVYDGSERTEESA
jgi:hypothetical protein